MTAGTDSCEVRLFLHAQVCARDTLPDGRATSMSYWRVGLLAATCVVYTACGPSGPDIVDEFGNAAVQGSVRLVGSPPPDEPVKPRFTGATIEVCGKGPWSRETVS